MAGKQYDSAEIQLLVTELGFADIYNKLTRLEKVLTSQLPKGTQRAQSGFKKLRAVLVGLTLGTIKKNFQTLGSAIRRTLAYGAINVFRNAFLKLNQAIRESAETSLTLGRAAAILVQGGEGANKAYDKLVTTITSTKEAAYLMTRELAQVSFTLAIAGVRGDKFNKTLGVIDQLSAVTGESSKSLSMDFIRLTNAFQIGANRMDEAADILIKGISNAVILMPDLLNAVKQLGPVWVMAFGPGIKSMKEFTAAVMAMGQVGYKGGQGARYLNRLMMGLMAPTQKVAASMYHMGVRIYDANGESQAFAGALNRVAGDTGRLQLELDRLTQTQAHLIATGGDSVTINKQIADTEDLLAQKTKALEVLYGRFVHAGGKIKPLHKIMREFGNLLSQNKNKALETFKMFKRLFQLRGVRATALFQNIKMYEKARKDTDNFRGALDNLATSQKDMWGMALREARASTSKINTLFMEMLGAPVLKAVNKALKTNVIEPIIEAFTKDNYWTEIRKGIEEHFFGVFEGIGTAASDLFILMFAPEKMKTPFEKGSKEWEDAMRKATDKLIGAFKPFTDAVVTIFRNAAVEAADAFMAMFEARIARIPILSLLTGMGRNISKLEGSYDKASRKLTRKAFFKLSYEEQERAGGLLKYRKREQKEMWKKIQAGELEKIPAVLKEFLKTAKEKELIPGERPGQFIPAPVTRDISQSLGNSLISTAKSADSTTEALKKTTGVLMMIGSEATADMQRQIDEGRKRAIEYEESIKDAIARGLGKVNKGIEAQPAITGVEGILPNISLASQSEELAKMHILLSTEAIKSVEILKLISEVLQEKSRYLDSYNDKINKEHNLNKQEKNTRGIQ